SAGFDFKPKQGETGYNSFGEALFKNAKIFDPINEEEVNGTVLSLEAYDDTQATPEARGEDNYLDGGAGNDVLLGSSGRDTLIGGEGSDRILGGMGQDMISGGEGGDGIWGDSYDLLDDSWGWAVDYIAPDMASENMEDYYLRAYFYKDDGSGGAELRYHADLHDGNAEQQQAYNALFNDVIDAGGGGDFVVG